MVDPPIEQAMLALKFTRENQVALTIICKEEFPTCLLGGHRKRVMRAKEQAN